MTSLFTDKLLLYFNGRPQLSPVPDHRTVTRNLRVISLENLFRSRPPEQHARPCFQF